MTARAKGLVVLALQMALVLSVAAKYAWERRVCPMVWTRASQFDPSQPLRGRYLALTLHASACGLGHGDQGNGFVPQQWTVANPGVLAQRWSVRPVAKSGILSGVVVDGRPAEAETLTLPPNLPCEYATLSEHAELFIAEHAKTPFPLAKGTELWALVTVPPEGPPRPVRLAISDGREFRVLDLR